MAHGDEIRGLLRAHHPGHLGNGQDIALGNLATLNFFKGFGLEKDSGLGCRHPLGRVLRSDIDHPGSTRLVEVRKFCHFVSRISALQPDPQGDYRCRQKRRSSGEVAAWWCPPARRTRTQDLIVVERKGGARSTRAIEDQPGRRVV